MAAQTGTVLISEVGPRDGLQALKRTMPTESKINWSKALAAAGLTEIEVGSFVSPKLLPPMADCAQVVAGAREIPGLTVLALAPNLKGAAAAFDAGVHKVSLPVSVSESHSKANINRTTEQAIAAIAEIKALRDGLPEDSPGAKAGIEIGLSTAFGCTIEGPVPEDRVIRMAALAVEMGAEAVGLSDTTGYGNPVRGLFG